MYEKSSLHLYVMLNIHTQYALLLVLTATERGKHRPPLFLEVKLIIQCHIMSMDCRTKVRMPIYLMPRFLF